MTTDGRFAVDLRLAAPEQVELLRILGSSATVTSALAEATRRAEALFGA